MRQLISRMVSTDLDHILTRSQCGAVIELDKLPLSSSLVNVFGVEQAEIFALSGGEDYELCFTVPDSNKARLERALAYIGVDYTCVGQVRAISPQNKNASNFNAMEIRLISAFNRVLIISNKMSLC